MNADEYLAYIGAPRRAAPTLAYLAELQLHHLYRAPFENLSVLRAEPIVLDEEEFVAKIVRRHRGGFCYELNGAFGWLLRHFGIELEEAAQ